MLSLNGFCGNWSWRSFIGNLDVMNAILYFAVCLSIFLSLRPTKPAAARFRTFLHPPDFASSNVFETRPDIADFFITFWSSKYRVGVV